MTILAKIFRPPSISFHFWKVKPSSNCESSDKSITAFSADIIISHLCTKNFNDMVYSSWYIEHDRLKLVILGDFLSFYPSSKNLKSQNFEKMENTPGNIIGLH